MNDDASSQHTRNKALAALGGAVLITVGAWFFIDAATDRGVARLEHIERVYAVCKVDYAKALTAGDTGRVDVEPLSAAVDSGKSGAPLRCGDLRRRDGQAEQDSLQRVKANRGTMPARDGR